MKRETIKPKPRRSLKEDRVSAEQEKEFEKYLEKIEKGLSMGSKIFT